MVLVTGGSGHIGTHLVPALLSQGRRVRALVHAHAGTLERHDVELVQGDVRDLDSLRRAMEGVEVVHHLAAKISIVGDPDGSVQAINVQGPANVAQAALEAGVRRFVHYSSCHAFDINAPAERVDESCARPGPDHPAYDRSKALGEEQVRARIEQGLDAVIVNPCGVLGPDDAEPSRAGRMLLDLATGDLPSLVEGGFNWVDVRDVVAGGLAAEERGRTGENYLLAGHWASAAMLAELVHAHGGKAPPWFTSPMWLARFGAPFVETFASLLGSEPLYTSEALHALRAVKDLSWDKAHRELGYTPRPTLESVRDALDSFREQGRL
jgi:dihydroflavonol-4-reductase